MDIKTSWRSPVIWVVLLTLAMLAVMFYSIRAGQNMAQRYSPQLGAIVQMRLETTTAHLWLEEIISGDQSIKIDSIWEHLEQASWLGQALLKGDQNSTTHIYPLQSKDIRQKTEALILLLDQAQTQARSRSEARLVSGIGSVIDQAFDETFLELYQLSEDIEADIKQNLQIQLLRFNGVHWGLALFTLLMGITAALILLKHERRRNQYIETLKARDQELLVSEKRYRALFDKSHDAIIVADAEDGSCLDANGAASKLTSRSLEELKMLTIKDITGSGSSDQLKAARATTGTLDFGKTEFIRPDSSIRTAHLTVIPLDGNKLIGIARDVSDELAAEIQLRRAQKMEAIGQLTGGIAHDFNNILGIILGNLDLLQKQSDNPEKFHQRVATIKESALRAADLTSQLLGFARKHAAEPGITNVNQLLGDMDSLIVRSVTPRIQVDQQLDTGLWSSDIDAQDFKDAMLNLVLNARDAMPDGGKLEIATSNQIIDKVFARSNPASKAGEYVRICVTDTGTGIDKKTLQRIFEPFYTTKAQGKGTGLGLSMVYGFVKRSSGFITVESDPGEGTCFYLYLPKTHEHANDLLQPALTDQDLPEGDERLLVVDDELGLCEVAKETLQSLGYSVITAHNGEQALELLDDHPDIKLIFSDVIMPGKMDGFELVKQARTRSPNIGILLASGFSGHNSGESRKMPDTMMLEKPYSIEELAMTVRRTLDSMGSSTGRKKGVVR